MNDINRTDQNDNIRQNKATTFEIGFKTRQDKQKGRESILIKLLSAIPSLVETKQYIGVLICGLTLWGTSWFLFKDAVLPGSYIFNMSGVVIAGYCFGHALERFTTINPVVGMTFMGALYRNLGPTNFLENSTANSIDFHLRRIYPVIILTKGPLSWNWEYIKNNPVKVFSLATLPWIIECLSTAFLAHILLNYQWKWGLHLGAILSSVSPALIVPTVVALKERGLGTKHEIALLVGNAGGLDTAFTEGIFGVTNSAIFYEASLTYKIIKGLLAIFVGICLGIAWGVLCDVIPDHNDLYAPTVRSLLIFGGGMLVTYAGGYLGWGGTSGVAIMVCAGVAATRWSRRGWPINDNPVSEVYKLLWRIFEPMLFTLSGYFLDAVLVRVAADSILSDASEEDKRTAAQHANIIVIAILITSTAGSVLTTALGPILLSQDSRISPGDFYRAQTLSPASSFHDSSQIRRNNAPSTLSIYL
uniref:Cation/H+ exchanger transmembrane domain-containing protein n=1 Tax=Bombyx mori TaxID=7091 RepID=A0A8R2QR79_BOMMO|nr:sodium/hydrogen exchanger 9B2 isoform X4 [Bombyx mori]